MDITPCFGLVVNAPEIFADEAFQAWLTNGHPKLTWWNGGAIDEWSDIVLLVDPNLSGEGSDADMPDAIWERIVALCRDHFGPRAGVPHHMVRLTNLET